MDELSPRKSTLSFSKSFWENILLLGGSPTQENLLKQTLQTHSACYFDCSRRFSYTGKPPQRNVENTECFLFLLLHFYDSCLVCDCFFCANNIAAVQAQFVLLNGPEKSCIIFG